MNEFFNIIGQLKERNPNIEVVLRNESGHKFWRILIFNSGTEVFQCMGDNIEMLFRNAYSKLQVHRKELL